MILAFELAKESMTCLDLTNIIKGMTLLGCYTLDLFCIGEDMTCSENETLNTELHPLSLTDYGLIAIKQ